MTATLWLLLIAERPLWRLVSAYKSKPTLTLSLRVHRSRPAENVRKWLTNGLRTYYCEEGSIYHTLIITPDGKTYCIKDGEVSEV